MVSSLMAAGLSDVERLGAARSTFRVASADVVKALLDGGEARFDHRLEFEVGEDIGQVLFDAFADEFTDIEGIYALGDMVLFRARHLSGYQFAWSTWSGEGDATPATAKAVLRTMEGANWQAAPEPKKPRSRKTVNKANK